MSNSDNAESIFGPLLAVAVADTYMPLEWFGYVPYDPSRSHAIIVSPEENPWPAVQPRPRSGPPARAGQLTVNGAVAVQMNAFVVVSLTTTSALNCPLIARAVGTIVLSKEEATHPAEVLKIFLRTVTSVNRARFERQGNVNVSVSATLRQGV